MVRDIFRPYGPKGKYLKWESLGSVHTANSGYSMDLYTSNIYT